MKIKKLILTSCFLMIFTVSTSYASFLNDAFDWIWGSPDDYPMQSTDDAVPMDQSFEDIAKPEEPTVSNEPIKNRGKSEEYKSKIIDPNSDASIVEPAPSEVERDPMLPPERELPLIENQSTEPAESSELEHQSEKKSELPASGEQPVDQVNPSVFEEQPSTSH